ncbi:MULTISPECIES: serine/threonine-protein kinase [unclassified Streptomyces]|uniref:serine/threonine-protein kinase n=1 Tax=unclassified Streptomyces TaxID=2593676 RepID=UPI0027E4A46E|nr:MULTISPECIES: serine/threonine-protein kinase [unclassified Streptomyces]
MHSPVPSSNAGRAEGSAGGTRGATGVSWRAGPVAAAPPPRRGYSRAGRTGGSAHGQARPRRPAPHRRVPPPRPPGRRRHGPGLPRPLRSVQLLGSGLAHALQHIHRAGLIHRDLKPSNVLLTIDGPRVIDFGIARALESLADGDLTRTGAMIGSPGFMAPEQVRGERVTTACDVFCLGSVLAYAATGRLPFGAAESGGAHALMFRITQEDPDLTGVPAELAGVVRDCLAKDPAAPPAYFTPAPAPAPERRSAGATVVLVAVAMVVAIGAGGSVYAFMNNKGGDTPTPGPSSSASGNTAGTDEGGVPGDYLGTWSASIPGDRGASTRKLTIRQGDVGDQVLSLTAEGPPALGATYHCEFTAPLAARPGDGEPVLIGPSTVSVGRPAASCSPGKATELTLLPDGTLRRATTGSGESLIYTRSD